MRILDKYTIKNFLPPAIYCLVTFIFMYILIDIFANLNEILRNKVRFYILLKYYYLFVPIIFVQIAPIVMLLSTVYVFSDMSKHNEITAMKSSGINVIRIVKPFFLLGISVSLLIMAVNEIIVPQATIISAKIRRDYIERVKGAPKKDAMLRDVAIYGQDNNLFYIKEFNTTERKLSEIIVLEHDANNNLVCKVMAKSGRWEDKKWVFSNCTIFNVDENGDLIGRPMVYEKKIMDFKETPKDFYRGQFQAELMNYSQLSDYIRKFYKVDKKIANRLAVDLYYKTSFPFISFIVILLGVGFGLSSRKGGALWGIGASIAISFIYYGMVAISLAFGKGGLFPPLIAAWAPNILFLGVGIVLLVKFAK